MHNQGPQKDINAPGFKSYSTRKACCPAVFDEHFLIGLMAAITLLVSHGEALEQNMCVFQGLLCTFASGQMMLCTHFQ